MKNSFFIVFMFFMVGHLFAQREQGFVKNGEDIGSSLDFGYGKRFTNYSKYPPFNTWYANFNTTFRRANRLNWGASFELGNFVRHYAKVDTTVHGGFSLDVNMTVTIIQRRLRVYIGPDLGIWFESPYFSGIIGATYYLHPRISINARYKYSSYYGLPNGDKTKMTASYVSIGLGWNFERAQYKLQ